MLSLEYSPTYAASIAPARIIACPGAPAEVVRELLAQGLNAARGVQSRLLRFERAADEAARANLWNSGRSMFGLPTTTSSSSTACAECLSAFRRSCRAAAWT